MKERFQRHKWWMVTMLLTIPVAALATGVTNVFSPGTVISSAAVNQNFKDVTDRLTALESSNAGGVYTTTDGTPFVCGPSDGNWATIGEYADDDFDQYEVLGEDGESGTSGEQGGVLLDYNGTLPRKVSFQKGAITKVWDRNTLAYVPASTPNLIGPVDGVGVYAGAVLTSAAVISDTSQHGTPTKPFYCQRTQVIDLAFKYGGVSTHQRDTVIMTSVANGALWNVAEYFTNSDGATILTSYQWQQVPPQP
jgi:hypothetical protein